MKLYDLLDPGEVTAHSGRGYIRTSYNHDGSLGIIYTTEKCELDRAWDVTTSTCQGVIYDTLTQEVISRPWPKIFDLTEVKESMKLDPLEMVSVSEKWDGTLGILYYTPKGLGIATRGSFDSIPAQHGTKILRDIHDYFRPLKKHTYLFEIIYPENRKVVDYGELEDLILLDVIDTETGGILDRWSNEITWEGEFAREHWECEQLEDVFRMEPDPGSEGVVIKLTERDDMMIQVKEPSYVEARKALTTKQEETAEHILWEYTAVEACRFLITDALQWTVSLGISSQRAGELVAVMLDYSRDIRKEVPVSFPVATQIRDKFRHDAMTLHQKALEDCTRIMAQEEERPARWELVKDNPMRTEMMRYMYAPPGSNGARELKLKAWRMVEPIRVRNAEEVKNEPGTADHAGATSLREDALLY